MHTGVAIGEASVWRGGLPPNHWLSRLPLALCLPVFLVFAHRACAAFLASAFRSSGERASIRAFTPLPFAAFPPFLPISRITLETKSRLMISIL